MAEMSYERQTDYCYLTPGTPYYGPRPCGPAAGWEWTPEQPYTLSCIAGREDDDPCRCGVNNTYPGTLEFRLVPTYYQVVPESPGGGRLRIAYWWFYGWQGWCSPVGEDGAHHGDWEHIIVTTTEDRSQVEYVTYFFHGDWYTRRAPGFETDPNDPNRPFVYVGKIAHGSYHDQTESGWMVGTPHHCCEYADYRNPTRRNVTEGGTLWNTHHNLVSLALNEEPWMLFDRVGEPFWINYPPSGGECQGLLYVSQGWNWGPEHAYCNFDFGGCWDWGFSSGCTTHPTTVPLTWDIPSCSDEGCEDTYCSGLIYSGGGVELNQWWPEWESGPPSSDD
jgi:hypothetical protein